MNNPKAPLSTKATFNEVALDPLAQELMSLESDVILQTYKRLPLVIASGQGVFLYDTAGKEYIDFVAGIAVDTLGHSHPEWVRALTEQASKLVHTSNIVFTEPGIRLAKKLVDLSGMDRVFFCNSGTEAVEASIKIARKWGKKKRGDECYKVISFERGFHGRTFGALSATSSAKYQDPFKPLVPGFTILAIHDHEALRAALDGSVCAIIIEPVQGEGGVWPTDPQCLKALRKLCDEKEVLLIADEIQTGIGRTGTWFAYQQAEILPDLVPLAKGLGGGFPIGACLARGEAATALEAGDHGSTFAGSPLATATASSVINVIEKEALLEQVKVNGEFLKNKLQELCDKYPDLDHVRGLGLIQALELKKPDARKLVAAGLPEGVLLNATSDTTLRFVPPLIITKDQICEGLSRLEKAILTL